MRRGRVGTALVVVYTVLLLCAPAAQAAAIVQQDVVRASVSFDRQIPAPTSSCTSRAAIPRSSDSSRTLTAVSTGRFRATTSTRWGRPRAERHTATCWAAATSPTANPGSRFPSVLTVSAARLGRSSLRMVRPKIGSWTRSSTRRLLPVVRPRNSLSRTRAARVDLIRSLACLRWQPGT